MESILTLSSADASSSSGGNQWKFPLTLAHGLHNGLYEVELLKIAFSHTQYPVNSSNNTFYFQEETLPTVYTVTIPPGYYTGPTLAAALTTVMDAATVNTVTVTYSPTTYKFTFTGSDKLRFLDNPQYSAAGTYRRYTTLPVWRLLGCDVDTDAALFSTVKTSQVSAVPADFSGSLYVKVLFPGKIPGPVVSNSASSTTTALIVLPAFGEIVDYEPRHSVVHLFNGATLAEFVVEFFDDTHRPYTIPFDLCLQLSVIPK